jgi:hypothetical protein
MVEFKDIDQIPGRSLSGAVDFLNEHDWFISYKQIGEYWFVMGGDQPLLKADFKEIADAFILGLAYGFAMLTEEMREEFKRSIAE